MTVISATGALSYHRHLPVPNHNRGDSRCHCHTLTLPWTWKGETDMISVVTELKTKSWHRSKKTTGTKTLLVKPAAPPGRKAGEKELPVDNVGMDDPCEPFGTLRVQRGVLATKAAAVVGVWCIVTTRRIVSPLSGANTS